jgi:hypothetical protein
LKIARGKVKEDEKYTCPICDWRVKIPRDAARPKLEDLQQWQDEIAGLPFQPDEEDILDRIIDNAQNFRTLVAPFCNPIMATSEEADTQRFYLRKIEGAEILLSYETNYFRQELHKWAPVAPEPPPVLEVSTSTRKPRPTQMSQLLCALSRSNQHRAAQIPALQQLTPSHPAADLNHYITILFVQNITVIRRSHTMTIHIVWRLLLDLQCSHSVVPPLPTVQNLHAKCLLTQESSQAPP